MRWRTERRLTKSLSLVSVCVLRLVPFPVDTLVCARARVCVCVCVCVLTGNPRFKPSLTEAYEETKQHVVSTIAPLQIAGGEGDVILTHGRTFHMGSRNLSSNIRQAMFYDVVKKEVDAKFSSQVDDRGIPDRSYVDMWHDWSTEVRQVAAMGAMGASKGPSKIAKL